MKRRINSLRGKCPRLFASKTNDSSSRPSRVNCRMMSSKDKKCVPLLKFTNICLINSSKMELPLRWSKISPHHSLKYLRYQLMFRRAVARVNHHHISQMITKFQLDQDRKRSKNRSQKQMILRRKARTKSVKQFKNIMKC